MNCELGYTKSDTGECIECSASKFLGLPVSPLAMLFILFSIGLITFLALWKKILWLLIWLKSKLLAKTRSDSVAALIMRSARAKGEKTLYIQLKTKGKILASFYQIVTQFSSTLTVSYPANFRHYQIMISGLCNLDWFSFLEVGCIVGNSFYKTLLVTTLAPGTWSPLA